MRWSTPAPTRCPIRSSTGSSSRSRWDPLADTKPILRQRRGYGVYFATTMAVLLRSPGIPCRLAFGERRRGRVRLPNGKDSYGGLNRLRRKASNPSPPEMRPQDQANHLALQGITVSPQDAYGMRFASSLSCKRARRS
ncbi:MAG: transglutaminase domain-containing protein [Planctomycetes bacterium]|nr:transglutaminase domain-containing protein [Planctomycetota bacterium]